MKLFDFFKSFKKGKEEPKKENLKVEETKTEEKETEQVKIEKPEIIFDNKTLNNFDYIKEHVNEFIAIDVETTGFNQFSDRIVEISAVLIKNGNAEKSFQTLVKSEVEIPIEASNVNHITNEMIADAPSEKEAMINFYNFLVENNFEQSFLCMHNAYFDLSFIEVAFERSGISIKANYVDTLIFAKHIKMKKLHNYKLHTLAMEFSIFGNNWHRAEDDAKACGLVMCKLFEKQEKEIEKENKNKKEKQLTDEEKEILLYFKGVIESKYKIDEYLMADKISGNYASLNYLYPIIRIKLGKRKYVLVSEEYAEENDLKTEPATKSESTSIKKVRYFFETIDDLKPLNKYVLSEYKETKSSAKSYMRSSKSFDKYEMFDNQIYL